MTSDKLSSLALLLAALMAHWVSLPPDAHAARRARRPAQGTPAVPADEMDDEEFFDDAPAPAPGARGNGPAANPFAGGATPNPSANAKGAGPAFGGDDFSEEDDLSDDMLRQKMEERLRQKAAASGGLPPDNYKSPIPPGGSRSNNSGVIGGATPPPRTYDASLGGGASGGSYGNLGTPSVMEATRGPGCLKLDPDTGYGPDVVTNFDFPDADIVEIAKTLGKLTCLNFILDKDVRGRISIVSNAPITVGDAWKAFLTALDVNQLTILPSGKYLRIAKQRDAKDKQLKIYSGAYGPDHDGMITRVIPLKYINAEEVRRVFMNITAPTTLMLAYEQTNTLIITDTAANIKKLTDLIALLDIEGYDEGLEVVKIKYASAEEIAKLIDQLLPGPGAGVAGGPPGVPRFGGGKFTQRKTKEGGVISHIIADARTNSLIVSANNKGFEQVKELIKKLDTRVSVSQGGSRIHVVYLQYADAEQVATTLNNLTAGGAGAAVGKPGMPGTNPQATVIFEGNVKVAADKPTNSLVVTAALSDFMLVKRVITKLDIPRDQVYVEAVIMELSMDKSFSMSTSVVNPTNGIGFLPTPDFANFLTNPLTGVQGLALGFKSGKSVSVPGPNNTSVSISSIQGLISVLQQNTNNNVLATPQLLTLDNQEASIEIGESVPVPTVTAVQGAGTAQSFSREKVALSLTIKPQINKISQFVKMDIQQKFQDFNNSSVPRALQDQTYGTVERSSKTTVVVQDQDTVVLGGLMRDKSTEQVTKVPILGDIPILGWLFRAKSTRSAKTNLLVFITPRIIKQYQAVRSILDRKLKERDDFIERANGGDDPYQEDKLRLVRDLPALSELKDNYSVGSGTLDEEPEEEEEQPDPANPGLSPSAYKKQGALAPGGLPPSLQGLPQSGTNTAVAPAEQPHTANPTPATPPPAAEAIPTPADAAQPVTPAQ